MAAKIDYDVRCKRRFTLKEGTKGDYDVRYQWQTHFFVLKRVVMAFMNQYTKLI
jgi:hypothetical protein